LEGALVVEVVVSSSTVVVGRVFSKALEEGPVRSIGGGETGEVAILGT